MAFKPVTSATPARCSTNWAMKPHIGIEVNLFSSYLRQEWNFVKYICNNSYLNCSFRWKWRMIITVNFQFKQLERRSLKTIRASTQFELVFFTATRARIKQCSPSPHGCLKPTYIPLLEIKQSMCGFHSLVNVLALNFNQSPGSFYLTRWCSSFSNKMADLEEAFNLVASKFCMQVLNSHQQLAISMLIERKKDIFINLLTGFRNSLIFQALQLVIDCVSSQPGPVCVFVVSPLLTLVDDQVEYLRGKGVTAASISTCTEEEARW